MKIITPEQAVDTFKENIPEDVIECWNEMVMEHIQLSTNEVASRFTLKELSKKILQKKQVNFEHANQYGWFDLEEHFRQVGWKVNFDKPGYNESYDAYYYLSAPRKTK